MRASQPQVLDPAVDPEIDHDWLTLTACTIALVFSLGTMSFYSFGVFIAPITRDLHWTRGQVSGALSAGQIALVLASLLWGTLLDRFGPRKTILLSVAGLGTSLVLFSRLALPLWHLYFVLAALPLLAGADAPLGYSGVLVRRFQRRLGLALGVSLMGVGLGAAIVPPLAQHIIAGKGWRFAFVTLAVLALAVGLPAAWVATRNASGPVTRASSLAVVPILPLVRTRAFVLICCIFVLLGTAGSGIISHFVLMMTDHGISPSAAAKTAGLVGISTLLGRGAVGWLLDRTRTAYMLAGVCLVLAMVCVLLFLGGGTPLYSLAAVLFGLVAGAEIDFIGFLVRKYFGPAAFGRLYALAFAASALGPGAAIGGYSFDHFKSYHPALLFFISLCVVAAGLALAIPSPPRLGTFDEQ